MRVVRILQLIGLALLTVYLFILDSANPQTVKLPFLISLPTAWVVALALVLGFVVGWLSLIGRVARFRRENRALNQRLIKAGLEPAPPAPPKRSRSRDR